MSTESDLTTWAHQHISAIYEANSDHDLRKAFENTFSPSSEFFVNHQRVSRESMKEDMTKRRAACVSASVKWENSMVVPKDGDKPDEVCSYVTRNQNFTLILCCQAGIVAGFLVVTRSLKFRIRAAPAQLQTILTVNAK
jgi:hypothetical protein